VFFALVLAIFATSCITQSKPIYRADKVEGQIASIASDIKRKVIARPSATSAAAQLKWARRNLHQKYFRELSSFGPPYVEYDYFPELEFYRWRQMTNLHDGAWDYVPYSRQSKNEMQQQHAGGRGNSKSQSLLFVIGEIERNALAKLGVGSDFLNFGNPGLVQPTDSYYHCILALTARRIEFQYFPQFRFYRWRPVSSRPGKWLYVDWHDVK